jgi:Holliday junction DNA helicase RuvA
VRNRQIGRYLALEKRRRSEYHGAMFAFLRGMVVRKGVTHIELDVNGVGYQVFVPDRVHRKLVLESNATLLTYCYIREDAFNIYGFLREEDRSLFTTLLGVSGIGPKVAMSVLSAMSVQEFGRAILENDLNAFTKVSGIGKKGAQRIILEMKAKLKQDADLNAILGEAEEAMPDSDDVIAALCSLGCTLGEAKRAASAARKKLGDGASDEDLVRAALQSMAKV